MGSDNLIGAIRQQGITWTNVDQIVWYHMASLRHNMLRHLILLVTQLFIQNVMQVNYKEIFKALLHCPFVLGIHLLTDRAAQYDRHI